jgi:hypothetical protein
MSELVTTRDLTDAIIAERGGEQNFSAVQRRVAMALSAALAHPDKVDPSAVAKLVDQLPPLSHSRSNDADVDAMLKSVVDARGDLTSEQTAIARALATALCADSLDMPLIERLSAMLPTPHTKGPAALEVTFRNAGPDAEDRLRERIGDLERENRRLRVWLPRDHQSPVETIKGLETLDPLPSNVTPLHSLEVTTTLAERYRGMT